MSIAQRLRETAQLGIALALAEGRKLTRTEQDRIATATQAANSIEAKGDRK